MPTQTSTEAERHQRRWTEIVNDPALRDLPYKVETNAQGQLIVSPHQNTHSFLQASVRDLLQEHAPDGPVVSEFALATPDGVKVPDVVWMSSDRRTKMEATGDPATLAPELCVEVMSDSNTEEEMEEKRALYRKIGADEVWVVGEDGSIRFFRDTELNASQLVPNMPRRL